MVLASEKNPIFSAFSKTSVLEDRVHITILSSVKQNERKLQNL